MAKGTAAEVVTSPMDSPMQPSSCIDPSSDQSPTVSAKHGCPTGADDTVNGVTSFDWVARSQEDVLGDVTGARREAVTIHRCRSDDTLSSVSDWRARNPQETAACRRYPVETHRAPLSRQHRILVEINRRDGEDFGDAFPLSAAVNTSSRCRQGALRRRVILV